MTDNNNRQCPHCGSKLISDGYVFCPDCGGKLTDDTITGANNSASDNSASNATNTNESTNADGGTAPGTPAEDTPKNTASGEDTAKQRFSFKDISLKNMDKKRILMTAGGVVGAVVIIAAIIAGAVYSGIVDGARFGVVNKEKSLAKIDKYIAEGQLEKAADYAVLVQDAKNDDIDFLKQLVYKINPVCPVKAYQMANNYASETIEESIDADVTKWLEFGHSAPAAPSVGPAGGTYVYPPKLSITPGSEKIGHGVYYTKDGKEPDENSSLYYNGIDITRDCTVKLVTINGLGQKSAVVTQVYEIDGSAQNKMEDTLKKAKNVLDNAVVGDNVGECLQGCKDDLETAVKNAEAKLGENGCTVETGNQLCDDLNSKITALDESKVANVDRSALNSAISDANSLYSSGTDSEYSLQLKNDLGILKRQIDAAESLVQSRNPKQDELDKMVGTVNNAMSTFNYAVKIVETDVKYNKYKGFYSYTHNHFIDELMVNVNIDRVSGGKLYGSFEIEHQSVEDDGRDKEVFASKPLNGIAIKDGKISFDLTGKSTYVEYKFGEDGVTSDSEQKTYTSGVEITMLDEGEIRVSMTNIGNTVDFNEVLYRD